MKLYEFIGMILPFIFYSLKVITFEKFIAVYIMYFIVIFWGYVRIKINETEKNKEETK